MDTIRYFSNKIFENFKNNAKSALLPKKTLQTCLLKKNQHPTKTYLEIAIFKTNKTFHGKYSARSCLHGVKWNSSSHME